MRSLAPLCVAAGLWLFAAAPPSAVAQGALSMEGGARVAALGGAGTALPGNAWSLANPAAPSMLDGRAVSFYATQGFGLSELRLGALSYAEPTSYGTFALGARTFGFDAFRETVFSLGYARSFSLGTSRTVHVGGAARYHRLMLGRRSDGVSYGSAGALAFSLGALVRLLPRLTLGAAATNVNAGAYAEGGDLPQTLAVGLAYRAADRLLVTADAVKDIDFPLSARAGLEVTPVEVLVLRVGVANAPARVTAGAGLRLGALRARLAFERHETLGWTPAAGLAYAW
jgi:hypothetical protein